MEIKIESFSGEKFVQTITDSFRPRFPLSVEMENYVVFNLPFGFVQCSYLNSGLTIGLAEFNSKAPPFNILFSGNDSEIPYKIGFCANGKFQLNYASENFREIITADTNFIITPRNGSLLRTEPNTKVSFLYIFISPEFLESYFNIKSTELSISIANNKANKFLFSSGRNTPQIKLTLSEIFNQKFSGSLSKLYLESKTLELLSLFFQQFSTAENRFTNKEKDSILSAHRHILENLNSPPTINNLVKLSGLNEHKLQQGFKTIFGSTLQKHIRKLRLQRARQLILQDNYLVSEAAYEVGYSNMSHFASAFKQEYGVLPGEIKKY